MESNNSEHRIIGLRNSVVGPIEDVRHPEKYFVFIFLLSMMNCICKIILEGVAKKFENGRGFEVGVARWAKRVFCSPGYADSKNIYVDHEIQDDGHLQSGRVVDAIKLLPLFINFI